HAGKAHPSQPLPSVIPLLHLVLDTAHYKKIEEENKPGVDAVLVMADSVHALRIAYPNYFGDTTLFIAELQEILNPNA
ncbi:hypothetical protein, partial [Burkholderia multivorans]|uniref:hypothetical protein n=1 Tax=Burkholderia multivorans TaxID=87883 RepID=UPI0028708CDC